jgi:hypothetical protein
MVVSHILTTQAAKQKTKRYLGSQESQRSPPHSFVMFLKASLVVVILLGAAMKCWGVVEELELANIPLQAELHSIEDKPENFTFQLAIGGYESYPRFRIRTSLKWENLNLDRVYETIVLNSSVHGPAFDDFCRLLTDGENMHVEKRIVIDNKDDSFRVGLDDFEQALFGNQTGCVNGVDLQGNYIDSIALTIEDFESVYDPRYYQWNTKLNLSLVFRGRPLFPNERDLAVVGPLGKMIGYVDNNSTRMHFSAVKGSRWATLEFMIDWNTAVVGEQISYVHEFGTHNIRELITDGDNGYIQFDFFFPHSQGRAYWESSFFEGQPGCFNGVDLEGNHVQDISLVLDEGSKYKVWESGTCTVVPKFVFSGSLGDGPTVCPDCECESDCEECVDASPNHTIATTVEILALVTGWAWFFL